MHALSPGDANHIISGSPIIVETALEHDRSNGPLTFTTGTAEISNALGKGAATSLEATAAAGAAALLGGNGECAVETVIVFVLCRVGIAGDVILDGKESLMTEVGMVFGVQLAGEAF